MAQVSVREHTLENPRVIVITGPVGAGKSTTTGALGSVLNRHGRRVFLADMDYLRSVYPHPDGDPFGAELGFRNLAAIWPNIAALGVSLVIVADVVETVAQRAKYEDAIPGAQVTIVRLDVPLPNLITRLKERETPETIEWYRERAPELQRIMEREGVGDLVIAVADRSADEVAAEIADRLMLI